MEDAARWRVAVDAREAGERMQRRLKRGRGDEGGTGKCWVGWTLGVGTRQAGWA